MGIKDETIFKTWYDQYITYAPLGEDDVISYGNLEKKIQTEPNMSLSEFKRHLAEAVMAGYAMGWVEGQYSLGIGNDHLSPLPPLSDNISVETTLKTAT